MTDPYRLADRPEPPPAARFPGGGSGRLRPALWLALVVSAAGNATTSPLDVSPLLSVAFGLVTVGSGVALAVHHHRGRRR